MNIARNMTSNALHCALSDATLEELVDDPQVFAIIAHGQQDGGCQSGKLVCTGMPQLGPQRLYEVWTTAAAVETSTAGPVRMAKTPGLLLSSITVAESGSIAEATRQAYELLLQAIRSEGYPCLLRAWHYMADINQGEGDKERYKEFCAGRHAVFCQQGISETDYPAASALGHASRQLVIYLFSARSPGIHIENPNQQSAYTYPKIYGPKSPAFARATVSRELGQTFVSGTASITGHETLHANDAGKQLELTLSNIERLVRHIETGHSLCLGDPVYKVYIRNPANLAFIKGRLDSLLPGIPCLYLQADVCRSDLLLEIEAVYRHL